jgi:hypothetical protein
MNTCNVAPAWSVQRVPGARQMANDHRHGATGAGGWGAMMSEKV